MPRKPSTTTSSQPDSKSKSARTRARILDAAAHVLSTKGYAGMRLSDVAEYAELQAPAIYYYFSSREDLIEEVMWFGMSDMRRHLEEALAAVQDGVGPLDRLMVAVETHLRHELEASDYATATIRNAGQLPVELRERQRNEEVRYGELWLGLLREAVAADEVRANLDLQIAQMLVMGALNWAAEWWSPRRNSLASVVTVAQSFVRHGLS